MRDPLFPDPAALAAFRRHHHIQRLSLFGSTLRGAVRPESDVDLLVECQTDRKPGLISLAVIIRRVQHARERAGR